MHIVEDTPLFCPLCGCAEIQPEVTASPAGPRPSQDAGVCSPWPAMKQEIEAKIAELNASHDENGDAKCECPTGHRRAHLRGDFVLG
jgi:hypothetical protein